MNNWIPHHAVRQYVSATMLPLKDLISNKNEQEYYVCDCNKVKKIVEPDKNGYCPFCGYIARLTNKKPKEK